MFMDTVEDIWVSPLKIITKNYSYHIEFDQSMQLCICLSYDRIVQRRPTA